MTSRFALAIGISNYDEPIHKLGNPNNDAILVANTLKSRGFDCDLLLDASAKVIEEHLGLLKAKVDGAALNNDRTLCVVYFAGHGVEINGAGYILPADFPVEVQPSAIRHYALPVLSLINAVSLGLGPKVIILDACREPVELWRPHDFALFAELVEEHRQQYTEAAEAHDVIIAYSTSAGEKAGDGSGNNSLYCETLCGAILRHDISIEETLSWVSQSVTGATDMAQRPWYYSSLTCSPVFSDLPRYHFARAIQTMVPVESRSRLHVRDMDGSVLFHDQRLIREANGLEIRKIIGSREEIAAIAVHGEYLFVIDANGRLSAFWGEGYEHQQSVQTESQEVFGLEVSPSAKVVIAYGMRSFSVIALEDAALHCVFHHENRGWNAYGAKFLNDNSVVLCGSNGVIKHIVHLHSQPQLSDLETRTLSPIYDLEVLSGFGLFAASCAEGKVKFFDLKTLVLTREIDLSSLGMSLPGYYHYLRDAGLSSSQSSEFLEDPEFFAKKFENDPDLVEAAKNALPSIDLLCCYATQDSRVLAVGSADGFILLVDVRSYDQFITLDVGGGRGINLQWMCCGSDGSIAALSVDGTLMTFESSPA